MRRVAVEAVENGMILAREVRGRSGNVLLNKGVAIDTFMGRRLKNWDVHFVHVEGEGEDAEEKCAAQVSPEVVREGLEKKFSNVMHDPVMKQIFAAVFQRKVQKGA